MKGKNRCRILKDIRRRIAEENDIEYVTTECKYKGDCLGTCPKCEAEVRYLERELERKRSLGYKISVAGLAAGITFASAGCTPDTTSSVSNDAEMGDMIDPSYTESSSPHVTSDDLSVAVDGEIVEVVGEFPVSSDTMGEETESSFDESATAGIIPPDDSSEEEELMGAPVEYFPGNSDDEQETDDSSDETIEVMGMILP